MRFLQGRAIQRSTIKKLFSFHLLPTLFQTAAKERERERERTLKGGDGSEEVVVGGGGAGRATNSLDW
jgi:hypothetical protein